MTRVEQTDAAMTAEEATRAAGFSACRMYGGRLLVTVYAAADVEHLRTLGYAMVEQAERFPGRADPGVMYECVWTPPREAEVE